jgi:hypothetical protein
MKTPVKVRPTETLLNHAALSLIRSLSATLPIPSGSLVIPARRYARTHLAGTSAPHKRKREARKPPARLLHRAFSGPAVGPLWVLCEVLDGSVPRGIVRHAIDDDLGLMVVSAQLQLRDRVLQKSLPQSSLPTNERGSLTGAPIAFIPYRQDPDMRILAASGFHIFAVEHRRMFAGCRVPRRALARTLSGPFASHPAPA